jgi:ATP-dependent DNA helicase RecQ
LLKLNSASWEVLKNQRKVRLLQIVRRSKGDRPAKSKADTASWEGVDTALFETLRKLRKSLADEKNVPPYVVFSDSTLRELARVRPSTLMQMRLIHGIGDSKLNDYGDEFLATIQRHCRDTGLGLDQKQSEPERRQPRSSSGRSTPQRDLAIQLFRKQVGIEEVVRLSDRARGTVVEYLCDFIVEEKPAAIDPWVAPELYKRIAEKASALGTARLKPIFVELDEKVTYDDIRIVLTHLQVHS